MSSRNSFVTNFQYNTEHIPVIIEILESYDFHCQIVLERIVAGRMNTTGYLELWKYDDVVDRIRSEIKRKFPEESLPFHLVIIGDDDEMVYSSSENIHTYNT